VDPTLFHCEDRDARRADWGLDGFVIGYVGRLTPEKGVLDLTAALERLWAEHGPEFRALFVGNGPLEGEIRAFARRLGADRVVMRSAVSHDAVPATMSAMDLLVLPSLTTPRWKEQFGRVMLEALCCGVPVVGSDSGEIPVLLQRTGGGMIFREGDVADLAAKLRTAMSDAERLRAAAAEARARIEDTYSCRAVAGQLHGICSELAG
jgi:glycosyltransferase involved in cell wall biosynthesis